MGDIGGIGRHPFRLGRNTREKYKLADRFSKWPFSRPFDEINALQIRLLEEALLPEKLPAETRDPSKQPHKGIGPKIPKSILQQIDDAHREEIHGEQ